MRLATKILCELAYTDTSAHACMLAIHSGFVTTPSILYVAMCLIVISFHAAPIIIGSANTMARPILGHACARL